MGPYVACVLWFDAKGITNLDIEKESQEGSMKESRHQGSLSNETKKGKCLENIQYAIESTKREKKYMFWGSCNFFLFLIIMTIF